jgi:hypothetical protein
MAPEWQRYASAWPEVHSRYHRAPLRRFLVLALPLLVLAMALQRFALEALGLAPIAPILPPGPARPGAGSAAAILGGALPAWAVAGAWCLEALGLTALFLLIHGRGVAGAGTGAGTGWWNGLLAGWIAWVFRGPLLVISVAEVGLSPGPWWSAALSWLALYTVCGLLLGALAQGAGLRA